MIRSVLARTLTTLITTFLTEKFILNLLVMMAEWAVVRWGNDLAEDLFEQFKRELDNDNNEPVNLYDDTRKIKPVPPGGG